jgi:hypothetical protein
MVKKTKITKGGKTFLERRLGVAEGSLVTDDVYDNIKKKKASSLLDEYRLRKDIAQLDYDIAQNRKDHSDELYEKLKDRNFKYDKLKNEDGNKKLKLLGDFINAIGRSIGYIFDKFLYLITKILPSYFVIARDTIYGLLSLIREFIGTGQGAIVKVLILFIIIIGLVTGFVFLFSGFSEQKSLLNKTNLNVFTKTPIPSFAGTFNTTIKGFIPDSFKRHLNSINSRFNNILGRDIKATSINRIAREVVKDDNGKSDGRYNEITNIKIENDDNNIHSIIKPKESQIISLNIDDYKGDDIDFNKLPNSIQELLRKNNEKLSLNFQLDKMMKNNNEIYRYKVINNSILENDKFANNKFNIISPDADRAIIKEKEKYKYMFKFNGDKFVYPEDIGTKVF